MITETTWADPVADLRKVLALPPEQQVAAAARTLRPQEMAVFQMIRKPERNPLGLTDAQRLALLEQWVRKILEVLRVEGFDL